MRVVLFTGMGADRRLLERIRLPGHELLTLDLLPPERRETLPAYAARLADHYAVTPDDVIGGTSFGGMLAVEIAARQGAAGLILICSAPHPSYLPAGARWIELISRFIPAFVLDIRLLRLFMPLRFGPLPKDVEDLMLSMSEDCPPLTLRRIGWMIAHWQGVESPPCPTLVIHGAKDRIIPLGRIRADLVLPDAGHALPLTHAGPINAAILEFLKKI